MSSIETLEERAAPSDSIGAFLGLGLAAELWPLRAPAATPVAAELSLATSSTPADEFFARLSGTREDETSSFDAFGDPPAPGESTSGVKAPATSVADDALTAAGAQLIPDPLASGFGAALSTSALDRMFPPVASPAPDSEPVPGADRANASAVSRGDSSVAQPALPHAVLNTASAQIAGGASTSQGADTTTLLAGGVLQPEGEASGDDGTFSLMSSNSAPVAVDDSTEAPADMPIEIDVMQNDYDPDGDPFDIYWFDATSTEGGSVEPGVAGGLMYTPPSGFSGVDTFTYDVIDQPMDFSPGLVSNRATVTITVDGGGGTNTPPDAVDDLGYTAEEQTVTYFVLENDTDPDIDTLTITSVSAASSGTLTWGSDSITYTPDPGTGGESLEYTIEDGNGGSDTATLTITMVTVTDYTLEWQQPDGSWLVVPDGELSWSHDSLRWTAHYSPADPPLPSTTEWFKTDWADVDNPQAFWESFAIAPGDDPAIGNPGAGEWAIRPALHFDMVGPQTAFSATIEFLQKKPVAEITSVQWAPHVNPEDGTPSDEAGELLADPDGFGYRIFPDADGPSDVPRNKVGLLITVTPKLAGVPVYLISYDVDDRSDHDGPIDDDPDPMVTHKNEDDNFGGGVTHTATGSTDADGQFRTSVTINGIQPGNNWRIAAAGRLLELLPVTPFAIDGLSQLWYDVSLDGFWDVNAEPIMDESATVAGVGTSPVLTVWRYLHVEVDSMGAPPPGTTFPDDGEPIDVNPGDLPAPDTRMLAGAFEPAFVSVVLGTPHDSGDVPFVYHVISEDAADRGIGESAAYWSVYIIGAYEPFAGVDGDPDGNWQFGVTIEDIEPEWSFVYHEVLRDAHEDGGIPEWDNGVYPRAKHEQQLVVHEIGHQFEIEGHPPAGESIMSQPTPTVLPADSFTEAEIKIIRQVSSP